MRHTNTATHRVVRVYALDLAKGDEVVDTLGDFLFTVTGEVTYEAGYTEIPVDDGGTSFTRTAPSNRTYRIRIPR